MKRFSLICNERGVFKGLQLVLWCLTPLSTIFQLYRDVLLVGETGVTGEKIPTDLPQVTDNPDHTMLYRVHLAWVGDVFNNLLTSRYRMLLIKTYIYNLGCTTRFWNNLDQVWSKTWWVVIDGQLERQIFRSGEVSRVIMFSATFNSISIFQLYRGGQFYCWRESQYPRKPPTCHKLLTNFIT